MKKLYLFATLLLLAHSFVFTATATAPSTSATASVLMEASSGKLLLENNAHKRMSMASTTKIMTALVALRNSNPSDSVTVSEKAVGIEGSSIYLKAGETLTIEQLLYALLLESANDAAAAIAIEIAGDIETFAEMMNDLAAEIGLTESHFTNPHGLDNEDHYTTAYDLAVLTRYALNDTEFSRIVSTYKTTIPLNGTEGTRVLVNHNKMLKTYSGAIGVKTGYTRHSGRCLVSAATRDHVTMIAVTLSAPDDWHDHTAMLDYGFSLYESVSLAEIGEFSCTLPCIGGDKSEITVSNHEAARVTLPIGHGPIVVTYTANRPLCAPIKTGDAVGEIIFSTDGNELARASLYADCDVNAIENAGGILDRVRKLFAGKATTEGQLTE